MNHPKPEEWVPYVCGEATPGNRDRLNSHLASCPLCQKEVASWRRTWSQLAEWKLPRRRSAAILVTPLIQWAAAAALVLILGFCLGRITGTRSAAEQTRRSLEAQLSRELRQELAQIVREEVSRATPAMLEAAGRQADRVAAEYAQALYAALKKDVDTLALNTDAGLRQTASQLVQLSDFKQPGNTDENTNP